MVTKELVDTFQTTYRQNEDQLRVWNERLLERISLDEWVRLLSERSEEIRRIYTENTVLLDQFWSQVPEHPDAGETGLLFDLVMSLYRGGYHDFSTLTRIAERILPVCEAEKDYGKVLFLSHVLGYEYNNFYRFDEGNDFSVAVGHYRRAIAQQAHYAEIDDPFVRSFIIMDYANLFFAFPMDKNADLERCLQIDGEAWQFWNSPDVQAVDGDSPIIPAILARIDASTLEELVFQAGPDHPAMGPLTERVAGGLEAIPEGELAINDFIGRRYCEYLTGRISMEAVAEGIIARFKDAEPKIDYARRSPEDFQRLAEYLSVADEIFTLLKHTGFPWEKKREYVRQFLPGVMKLARGIPYPYFPEVLNQSISQIYMSAQPYMEGEKEKIDGVLALIIRRQPITYIHSMMVTEISRLLLEEVFNRCPEELVGVLGCETKDDVLARWRELTRFVETCGLLHDVGKCDITDVINRQNRSLTDAEFLMIRNHPRLGPKILNKAPELERYFDVILGHHRTYDGKGGYPKDFDNTASPVRFVIDLISVADSTDAATDILGRNYSKGKNFAGLLEELKEGAGTRYNPRIVALIEESSALRDKLARLTSEGRYEVYYRAYRDIVA